MKILDWYILKRYLITFLMMLLLFVPIGITVDLAEKVGRMIENEASLGEVAFYYINFTVYFANLLFPLFLFLSVIWFTSKLANNTEIVAFLSSGTSFSRFLRPYMIGATIVAGFAMFLGMYLAPIASQGFNEFKFKYLKKNKNVQQTRDVYQQINDNDYIYVSNFITRNKTGHKFTYEHFEGNELKYKIFADNIRYIEEDSMYRLTSYLKRSFENGIETVEQENRKLMDLPFELEDLTPVQYAAETKSYGELLKFIAAEKRRGSPNIGRYEVVKLKKWSLPVSIFILTIIAVAVSSIKRRGGMGVNLALGISIAMIYVFFDKVFGVMAEQSNFPAVIAVWFPNVLFGILAVYLLQKAKR
ncbi:LptF/LptG family permease [Winogradskyella sp. APC 3343]|uniref:LptF/LptG family permease n=2 Tax=Winogradskyella bathintestinalis TaxID=3035208 RepID=A0ABT7ZWG8_9FLAO|nr:LptF/LptG family permease [Winogradskyella bathintestinalis]MDN3493319.1 LptF/LptG family permease [Winogradskyella bathintestinalis]